MTRNELLRRFPNASEYVLKHSVTDDTGAGPSPSFKNRKRAILDRNTGKMRTLTPGDVKKRMDQLENAILSALYSSFPTEGAETHLGCLKQLQIALSGLSDDSLKEIPSGSWDTIRVPKEQEGLIIEIKLL